VKNPSLRVSSYSSWYVRSYTLALCVLTFYLLMNPFIFNYRDDLSASANTANNSQSLLSGQPPEESLSHRSHQEAFVSRNNEKSAFARVLDHPPRRKEEEPPDFLLLEEPSSLLPEIQQQVKKEEGRPHPDQSDDNSSSGGEHNDDIDDDDDDDESSAVELTQGFLNLSLNKKKDKKKKNDDEVGGESSAGGGSKSRKKE
jgi:hypothetical protein